MTGLRRPERKAISHLVRARHPDAFDFADDGETPNNPRWPLVIYRSGRMEAGNDLPVVGAYPHNSGAYDQAEPTGKDHHETLKDILEVPPPHADSVYGTDGPLIVLWG